MCGICGELRFDNSEVSLTSLQAMTRAMEPRGPDSSGVVTYGPVGFGHRRLSIIDLSARGTQPMVDAKLGLTIAFNGCIYNYADLRSELATLGYEFFSNSDTETILKAYHAWGVRAVERFNGMFAFANSRTRYRTGGLGARSPWDQTSLYRRDPRRQDAAFCLIPASFTQSG